MDLTNKKCKACEGGTPSLTEREVGEYMKELPEGWQILDDKKLEKEFLFKDFLRACHLWIWLPILPNQKVIILTFTFITTKFKLSSGLTPLAGSRKTISQWQQK